MSNDRGRYSKVSRRIWNDAAFRALGHTKPSPAWLFFRLLTGPELTNIPGLFQAWEAGLAQALGWTAKDFRQCFKKVVEQRLVMVDWSVGLIFLPKAINHNEPESPNVVASWKTAWEELPECDLKDQARASLMAWCEAKGGAWVEAFMKATGKPSVKASPHPSVNQEQEQEQEQKQEQEQRPPNPQAFRMHAGWKPSPEVWASFDVAMIPRWASEALVAAHRSHFAPKASDLRTDEDWNQSCSKWVHGDWNNPRKRPKRPDAESKADETGGFGAESEWSAGA